jgi:hypothetical protein
LRRRSDGKRIWPPHCPLSYTQSLLVTLSCTQSLPPPSLPLPSLMHTKLGPPPKSSQHNGKATGIKLYLSRPRGARKPPELLPVTHETLGCSTMPWGVKRGIKFFYLYIYQTEMGPRGRELRGKKSLRLSSVPSSLPLVGFGLGFGGCFGGT